MQGVGLGIKGTPLGEQRSVGRQDPDLRVWPGHVKGESGRKQARKVGNTGMKRF